MTNQYTLTKKDLLNMGLTPTNAVEYSIEQSGWSSNFYNMYEVIENEFGSFKGEVIVTGSNLTNDMFDYIVKKCKCVEYN